MQYVIAYLGSGLVFLGIDFVWLAFVAKGFYRQQLGPLMRDSPDLGVAALFYLVYIAGIVFFAVLPAYQAQSWKLALFSGAFLGLVAYGTYDITNLATIRDWPQTMSIVDMLWGTVLTGTSAFSGYLTLRYFGA